MTDRRLIEEELPLKEVNAESAREKSLRHGNISTMHLWWARRPLAMSRAVVFGTLLPDPGDDAERNEVLKARLRQRPPSRPRQTPARINPLRRLLAEAYPDGPPKVLDCFAGGGAIPLEALRLGCDSTAVDLNPVAHLIEKCVLEYPQRFGQPGLSGENSLGEDFVKWADWVRDRVKPKLDSGLPFRRERPAVLLSTSGPARWSAQTRPAGQRSRCSPPFGSPTVPGIKHGLRSAGRPGKIDLGIRIGAPPAGTQLSDGTVKASSVTCPGCGTSMVATEVREYATRDRLRPHPVRSPRHRRRVARIVRRPPRRSSVPKGWPQHSWTSWRRRRTGHRPCPTSRWLSRSTAATATSFTA